jgi:hypothetical protein
VDECKPLITGESKAAGDTAGGDKAGGTADVDAKAPPGDGDWHGGFWKVLRHIPLVSAFLPTAEADGKGLLSSTSLLKLLRFWSLNH